MKIGYLMQAGAPDIRVSSPSGPANHVLQVCTELRARGHQVRLIARLQGRIWKTDDLVNYEPVSVPALDRGPLRLAERVVRRTQSELQLPYFGICDDMRFSAACCRELKGYDLLYERMGWMGGGGSRAARRLGVPHVLELNGDHLLEHQMLGVAPSGLQRQLSIRLMRKVTRNASHTVATGEGWRQKYIDEWGVEPSQVSVVQNGSVVVDLLPRSELQCFGSSHGAGEPLRLIHVGAFDPWQNLPLLLRTLAKALATGSNLKLLLAGTGLLREELEAMCADLNLREHVTFAGHVPMQELLGLLKKSDVGLSLYRGRKEYTGLKLLDYKSAGLATIATGADGEPSLIRHGRTGLIVPPEDGAALLAAIQTLDQSRNTVAEFGRQARLEAEQQHSWGHTAAGLEALFTAILERRSNRSGSLHQTTPAGGSR